MSNLTQNKSYTINFIDSLRLSDNSELPKQTITHIDNIDKELNKYFKFLLDKKPYNSKKKYSDKKNFDNKKVGDSSWRLKQKRKKIFSDDDGDEKSISLREINLTLNKINVNNYNKLKENIIVHFKDKELLSYIVENMFQKAVSQPGFCDIYVKLYKELISIEETTQGLVSNIISQKCDSYLDILGNGDNEFNSEDNYDKICEIVKQKEYIKGYSQFIGDLHNNGIIEISKINLFINTILNNIEFNKQKENEKNNIEEYINSLYAIIECIGMNFNNIDEYQIKKETFIRYSKDSDLTSKAKFKFMDISDLLK